jgi:large subunit ribosomal protein L22
VRLVARTLRDLPVSEALVACSFMPKSAARDLAKVIRSAQANAENNFNLVRDDLVIKDIRVEPGPMLKRGQPRAMGRLFSIFKRTSHITAIVEDRPGAVRRRTAALPRAPQPAARPSPTANATAAARAAAASQPATTESDEREAPKPKRGKAEPKAQVEGSTGTEVGKKTQAKKTDKSPQAKTTNGSAEGKEKDKAKDKKQDKKGK